MPWITSLRPLMPDVQPSKANALQTDLDGEEKETKKKQAENYGHPPSFYDNDLEKKANKFKEIAMQRQEYKNMMKKRGQAFKINERNTNVKPDAKGNNFKRRYSRASAMASTNVDFGYVGNSAELQNVLDSRNVNAKNPQFVNYITSLRNWEPKGAYKHS